MYASQKVQVFSSLRRPETHFRLAQGHHRAVELTGSINIIQNTIITVYEVESQKTVNKKLWKRTNWFSEEIKIKTSSQLSGELDCQTQKDRKKSCIAFLKLINRYYKIVWLKSTSNFKEQTRIPLKLTIKKLWCRQKRITAEQFMQISVHDDTKWTKRGILQPKNSKKNVVVVRSVLDSNCKRFRDTALREKFNLKPET